MAALRDTRIDLLTLLPPKAAMAELGVFEGEFSAQLLAWDPRELYLFDHWIGPMQCGDKDGNHIKTLSAAEMTRVYRRLCRRYELDPRVHVVRGDIAEELAKVPNGHFDFIYVDADHSYAATRAHLELAHQKLTPNGFLGGHDYGAPYGGVVRATDEFAALHQYTWVARTTRDGCPSFLLQKPA